LKDENDEFTLNENSNSITQKFEKKDEKIKLRSYQEAILNTELEIAQETSIIVEEMNQDFIELNTMFKDFQDLVNRQDAPLESIEQNVLTSVNAVDTAVENLKVGIERQKQGRWIMITIIGLFLLIVVGVAM
jgi:t-SNARE complex subunit (syntaxin)